LTGEMDASEVTRDNYPELFQVKDVLIDQVVDCKELPFDTYQGPFLDCMVDGMNFEVWYKGTSPGILVAKFKTKDHCTAFIEFFPNDVELLIEQIIYYTEFEIYMFEPDEIKAFEVDFNRDIKKFAEWIDQEKPRDFNGEPTIDEYVPWVTIGVDPSIISTRDWDKIFDKLFAFLQSEDMNHSQEHNFSIEKHY